MSKALTRGLFIALEGPDGSGKSTLSLSMVEELGKDKCIRTREPGGTMLAERIRSLLLSEDASTASQTTLALLFAAGRRDHVEKVILPTIEEGKHVISDRYILATIAYQTAAERLTDILEIGTRMLIPDITLVIDADYDTSVLRLGKRDVEDHFEAANRAIFNLRRDVTLKYAKENPERCFIIDGRQDMAAVHDEAMKIVERFLRK